MSDATVRKPLLSSPNEVPSMATTFARSFNSKLATFSGLFQRNFQDDIYPSGDAAPDGELCNSDQRNGSFLGGTGGPKTRHNGTGGDTKELDMLVLNATDCGEDSEGY